MEKRVFLGIFSILSIYVMFGVAYHNRANIVKLGFKGKNLEPIMEEGFPAAGFYKEYYGAVNAVILPNEIVQNGSCVIKDGDGYLLPLEVADDFNVKKAIAGLVGLRNFCEERGAAFSYISYPSKSGNVNYAYEYGVESDCEETRKSLLAGLDENQIKVLNVREMLEGEGFTRQDIFYKTDHHWNTQSGLYAAGAVAEWLSTEFGIMTLPDMLDTDLFTYKEYSESWLGETGRKYSKKWVGRLDDFILIEPRYETLFEYKVPGVFDKTGDFSVLVNKEIYDIDFDIYSTSLHYSYMPNAGPNTIVRNKNIENGAKVLIIKDSFSIVVAPFLSLACKEVNMWDMRNNQSSVYNYISENDFDVVLVAYTDFFKDYMYSFY